MASKEAEELNNNNTETEEGTIALQKKRSRRVSFAPEITSVHVFDRDEDFETPPDPKPSSVDSCGEAEDDEVLGFFRELADIEDSNDLPSNSGNGGDDDDDDEVMDGRKPFFRSMESPSPRSTIGSATSNDDDGEENFFGPVSASFIRPGRYSDSAASEDDNHDVTMDSTAFSMHFRSLARSESGGDLKTPTGITNLAFEQKTPTPNTTSCKLGSFMVLTGDKKPILRSPVSVEKRSHGNDSNDMSLVGENPNRYDYARLSPRLDALLAEGSKDLSSDAVFVRSLESPSYPNKESEVSKVGTNSNGPMDPKDSADAEPVNHGFHDRSAEAAPVAHTEVINANSYSSVIPIDDIIRSSDDGPVVDASFLNQAQSPNHLNRGILLDQSKEPIEDAFETSRSKAKLSDINIESLSDMESRVNQLDFSTKHVSRYLHSPGGRVEQDSSRELRHDNLIHYDYDLRQQSPLAASKSSLSAKQRHENSPREGMRDPDADQSFGQKDQSTLAGSASSLYAKERQVFLNSAKSPRLTRILTPERWTGSFLSQESIRHSKSMSSIRKSISKLNSLRSSPNISILQDGNDNSRRRLSDFLSIPSFDANSKDPKSKHVDVPITRLEEQFLRMDQKKVERGSATNMDSNVLESETPKTIKNLITTEESTDTFNKSEAAVIMSSPLSLSGMKVPQLLMASENFTEGALATSGTDSSLVEATLQHGKEKIAIESPKIFVSSHVKRLNKLAESSEYKGNLATDLMQQNESNKIVRVVSEDRDCVETVSGGSQLSAKAQKTDMFFAERRAHPRSPLNEINNSKDPAQIDDFRVTFDQDLCEDDEAFTNLETSLRKIETLNIQLGTPSENRQFRADPGGFRINLTGREITTSSHGSDSPYVSRGSTNQPSPKEIQSPSRKYSRNVSQIDNLHSSVENSSGMKRRREELVNDGDRMDEIAKIQKIPKIQNSGSNNTMILFEHSNENNDERLKIGGDISLKHLSDMFSKFSAELESLHSPLVDKLNLRAIGGLEDILDHLQKVKTFEMLCRDIQSQKISDRYSEIKHKRASETRSLLCRLIYGRAKLQLLRMKRERLLKRVDVLRYGTQECQSLKMKYFQDHSVATARDAQVDDSHHQSFTVQYGAKHVVANDKVATLKQEAEASQRKIKHLVESFHTRLKVKGELSSADTLVLVNDHLKKRTCCRFIRQDLQLWEVDKLEGRNGHHDIIVNYHGFIFQRFTLGSPVSSTSVANKLNDANIVKKFPNMDACTAFAFVLKADNNWKYVGKKSLAQETQMTSSLLCNLLDVIEEVHLARVELSNLTDTRFHSPSVERLDLQLDFIDLRSGEKMILTLDMSCLDCGVYPSEILPSKFQASGAGAHTSPPQPLFADMKAAMEGLKVGYFRIIRLCRCISQFVAASGW